MTLAEKTRRFHLRKYKEEVIRQVERVLRLSVESRNSDKALIMNYMTRYCPAFKKMSAQAKKQLVKAIIIQCPSFETITRRRRELQEKGVFPASANTQQKRQAIGKAMRLRYR